MTTFFVFLLFIGFIGMYAALFIYPHYLKPVEFDLSKESENFVIKKIQNQIRTFDLGDWEKVKNSENVLVFIYLFQMSDQSTRRKLMNYFQLPFDPMVSKSFVQPTHKTLAYIHNYVDQLNGSKI